MSLSLLKEFSKYEDEVLKRYEKHPIFSELHKMSNDQFIDVVTQGGEGISANFVKFLETVLRQLKNEKAQEAIIRILRDEIPATGPTHQQMRSKACEAINISPLQLASTHLTKTTKKAIEAYYEVFCNPKRKWHNRDLGLVAFIRVMGESMVAIICKLFTQEMIRRFGITENDIEFYSLHWHHDEKRPVENNTESGHTEYYDMALTDLLETEDDLKEAKEMADLALDIRWRFQDQFVS